MQTKMIKLVGMATVALALSACASSGKDSKPSANSSSNAKPVQEKLVDAEVDFDNRKEVAYACGNKGQQHVLAMYGFKNNAVAGVQVLYKDPKAEAGKIGQTPLMLRTTNPKYNEFATSGLHIKWTQNLASPANVDQVDAKGLTMGLVNKELYEQSKGKEGMAVGIIVESCKVEPNLTAKLATSSDGGLRMNWLNSSK